MSKLPAQTRFLRHRFRCTLKPKNLPYYPEGAGVEADGYYNEMADEYEDPKFSELLKDLNVLSRLLSQLPKLKLGSRRMKVVD